MSLEALTLDSYTRDPSRNPEVREVASLAADQINDMLRDLPPGSREEAYRRMVEQFNKVIGDEGASFEARLALMLTQQYMEQGGDIAAELAREIHAA